MEPTIPTPRIEHRGPPNVRRWSEQRWLLDNIIRANGIDWDQPRSLYLNAPCGAEANGDFAQIRARVQKMADIGPAFAAAARRREQKARDAEAAESLVTARDNYFMAAIHWGAAQWPYDENDAANLACNQKKRECYQYYARLADHHVEAVWLPFGNSALPAWFHLPPNYRGGKLPAVIVIPGMDSFKEMSVALHGDRWLTRGIAVLAVDGPGQYEAPIVGINVSMENWTACGPVCFDWLAARAEIDPARIAVNGTSFGSFFATIVAGSEPRLRACAVTATCLEPGAHTIFEEASPTFKKRFMYMSGYTDEAAFDAFRQTLTWEKHVDNIACPYLCIAGEFDELSPMEHTEHFIARLRGPKQLVVYAEARHAVGAVPSTNLGPFPPILAADWTAARLAGKPFASECWYVDPTGRIAKDPL